MKQGTLASTEDVADQSVVRDFMPLPRKQLILTMLGVTLAMFLAASNQTIILFAIPFVMADLGALDQILWVSHLNSTAYLIVFSTAVLIVGRLTDIYGRRLLFTVGIAIFLVGSVFGGLSASVAQFIAFRALQGLGAGVMVTCSFIAIADVFPPEERGKFQGLVGSVFGFSLVMAPTLGGFVADSLSWHWIFLTTIPVGVLALLLISLYFPGTTLEVENKRLDYAGLLTLAALAAIIALSFSVVQYGWASTQDLALLAIGVLILGSTFVIIQFRTEFSTMPPELCKNRTVLVTLLATLLTGFAMSWAMNSVPYYFSFESLGNVETSGTVPLIPMALGLALGAVLSGALLSRIGGQYRMYTVIGTGVMLVGAFLIARTDAAAVGQIVMGLGLGSTFPTFMITVQNSIPFRRMGISTSAVHFSRLFGGMIASVTLGLTYTSNVREISLNPPESGSYSALMSSSLPGLPGDFNFLEFMRAEMVGDTFILSAAVIALALTVSLFLGKAGSTHRLREAPMRQCLD